MKNNAHLTVLSQYPEFEILKREIAATRPLVPPYDPKTNNVEDMKFQSAKLQMFETIFRIISPSGVKTD
jgi:hypothetical protein